VIQSKPTDVLKQIKSLQGLETTQTSSHSLEDWGDLSLLYNLKHTHTLAKMKPKAKGLGEGCLPQQPYGSIYRENKRLECPYGLNGKLHLIKDSLVRLSLCRTRHHRTDRLLLHFHMTSVMMPRAPPAIATPPVLRQN
jgi:hypothetical protein